MSFLPTNISVPPSAILCIHPPNTTISHVSPFYSFSNNGPIESRDATRDPLTHIGELPCHRVLPPPPPELRSHGILPP